MATPTASGRGVADTKGPGTQGLQKFQEESESNLAEKDGSDPNASLNSLARLAVDSGGRFTERTNDLTRGVMYARRDLGCVYSLGFYDRHPEDGRIRDAVVRIRKPGVRPLHASKFVYRSPATRRESMLRAGFLSHASDPALVQAKLYPLRPLSGSKWDGMLAVGFELSGDESQDGDLERDFGGVLYHGSKVTHRFGRRVTLKKTSANLERRVVYLEPISVKPGQHSLQVVVSDPVTGEDQQVRVEIEVPEVPRDRLFVVGPILGRRAESNLILKRDESSDGDTVGRESSFEPLLTNRVGPFEDVLAMTRVCRFETRKPSARAAHHATPFVHRELLGGDRAVVGRLPDVDLALAGDARIRCQNLLDLIPTSSLKAGKYAFRIFIADPVENEASESEVSFEVGAVGSSP